MLKFKINGQEVEALPEWTVLDAAREKGIHIPTLCYHEAVGPSGACRLCVVEVVEGNWSKVVISCMYPVKEGISVLTDSDRVKNVRRWILEMLLAECPASKEIQTLAAEYGIKNSPFFCKKSQRAVHVVRIMCSGLPGGGGCVSHHHSRSRGPQGYRNTFRETCGGLCGLRFLCHGLPHRGHADQAECGSGAPLRRPNHDPYS